MATAVQNGENTGISIQNASKATASVSNPNSKLGKDEFIQLLVAQMKYQDPLDPMSNTDSIAQLANFSSLEQMQNLNDQFAVLSQNQTVSNISSSAQFIGKEAKTFDENQDYFTGIVRSVVFSSGEAFLKIENEEGKEIYARATELVAVGEPGETDFDDKSDKSDSSDNKEKAS